MEDWAWELYWAGQDWGACQINGGLLEIFVYVEGSENESESIELGIPGRPKWGLNRGYEFFRLILLGDLHIYFLSSIHFTALLDFWLASKLYQFLFSIFSGCFKLMLRDNRKTVHYVSGRRNSVSTQVSFIDDSYWEFHRFRGCYNQPYFQQIKWK